MNTDAIMAFCKENSIEILQHESMGGHTSFKTGGKARLFATPPDCKSLVKLICFTAVQGYESLIIGNGSNLLVTSGGFDGVIISTQGLNKIEWLDACTVRAEAGVLMSALSVSAMLRGMTGLEFAQGIPGSVGGGVFMNAGAYDGEIANALLSTDFADEKGNISEISLDKHEFSYRHSIFKNNPNYTILSSVFRLKAGNIEEIKSKMNELGAKRREKQPLEYPSAGSVFKRPGGTFAAKLIEDCGLKGHAIGGAQVSEKHAGFIVNKGTATPEDIIMLMEHIEKIVLAQTGIALEREIRVI